MLEFGGGPVISNLISAVPHVQEIVFAAYTQNERDEIELWKGKKEGAHNWELYLRYVVNELEDKPGDTVWQEREALLRSRIKVIACDITQEDPLLGKGAKDSFDIISTRLCLEAACESYEVYKSSIKKLSRMLKLGGFLTMTVVERETFYMVKDKRWYCLYLTLDQIEVALKEAGFVILVAERDPAPIDQIQKPTAFDYKAILVITAQKVE